MTETTAVPLKVFDGFRYVWIECDVRSLGDEQAPLISRHIAHAGTRYEFREYGGSLWCATRQEHDFPEGRAVPRVSDVAPDLGLKASAMANLRIMVGGRMHAPSMGPSIISKWSDRSPAHFEFEEVRTSLFRKGGYYGNPSALVDANDMPTARELVAEHLPGFSVSRHESEYTGHPCPDRLAVKGAEMALWGYVVRISSLPLDRQNPHDVEALVVAREFLEHRWEDLRIDWRRTGFKVGATSRLDNRLGLYEMPERDPQGLLDGLEDVLEAARGSSSVHKGFLGISRARLGMELDRRHLNDPGGPRLG